MKTFKEYQQQVIDEMSIAMKGDIPILHMSIQKLKGSYTFVAETTTDEGEKLKIYSYNGKKPHFKIGERVIKNGEEKFAVLMEIDLTSIPNMLGYTNIFNVDSVTVATIRQGFGIARTIYLYFVKKLKYNLMGDEEQYFGSRKLWKKLSQHEDAIVDIIDIYNNRIIEKNVTLHHGSEDWDFDNRVWSYDTDKRHIRLILRDLKP